MPCVVDALTPLALLGGIDRAPVAQSLGGRLGNYFSHPVTILLLVVLVGCSLLLVLMRRRIERPRGERHRPGSEP